MTHPWTPPLDYPRLRVVHSFQELVTTPLVDGVNALVWPRTLPGDFAEVAAALSLGPGITTLEEDTLRRLSLSPAGREAVEVMLEDQRLLSEHGLTPTLDCVNGYLPTGETGPVRTDVCSYHADSATGEADTYLCTYLGASSEALRQEDAVRRIDVPATRAALLTLHGGPDDETFEEYLADHCYDLHYVPRPGTAPFTFGRFNLWRIALDYPGNPVPPCIHRAPDPTPGQRRLLLLS